jgi:hypothetical protein
MFEDVQTTNACLFYLFTWKRCCRFWMKHVTTYLCVFGRKVTAYLNQRDENCWLLLVVVEIIGRRDLRT